MHIINTFILSSFILYLIYIFSKKFHLFIENPSNSIRKIHNSDVVKIGGVSMLSFYLSFFYVNEPLLIEIIMFGSAFMLIGLFADLNPNLSGKIRFYIMVVLLIFFIWKNNFVINNYDHVILDQILNISIYIQYLFVLMGLMFSVNGFNFIDGNNGLMTGVALIILFNFLIYIDSSNIEAYIFIQILTAGIAALFLINFFTGKIISGDCGAYFIGFIIGTLSIYISNNSIIYSTLIACIICYPINELFISFWRRLLFDKKNPLKPDDKHMHSVLYKIICYYFERYNFKTSNIFFNPNSSTSIVILSFLMFSSIFIYLYGNDIGYLNTFFIISFLQLNLYLFLMIAERKLLKKNY